MYRNYAGVLSPDLPGGTLRDYNFSGTVTEKDGAPVLQPLWAGDETPRTLIDCNISGRAVGDAVTIVPGCCTAIVQKHVVVEVDELVVDGEVVARTEIMGTKWWGKVDPATKEMLLLDEPVLRPNDIQEVRT